VLTCPDAIGDFAFWRRGDPRRRDAVKTVAILAVLASHLAGANVLGWADSFRVPVPSVSLRVESCPGYRPIVVDCYDPPTNTIYLTRQTVGRGDRWTLAHEMGHAYDYTRLEDDDRVRLLPLLGYRPDHPWRWQQDPMKAKASVVPPEETFADAYAACASRWDRGYGRTPTGGRLKQVCALIRAQG
jgi:hypothetical protein